MGTRISGLLDGHVRRHALAMACTSLVAALACAEGVPPTSPPRQGESSSGVGGSFVDSGLAHCDAPMAAIAVVEPRYEVVAELQRHKLSSPAGLVRSMIQRSNCFIVVGGGAGLQHSMPKRQKPPVDAARSKPPLDWSLPMLHPPDLASWGQRGGQMLTADFVVIPSVTLLADGAGGINFKGSRTSLLVRDSRTGVQVAATEGRTDDLDQQLRTRSPGSAAAGPRDRSSENSIIAAAFMNNFNALVGVVRSHASLQRQVNRPRADTSAAGTRMAGLAIKARPRMQGTVQDQYSPIVSWQQASGSPVRPIHSILLPNGNLFFLEPYFGMTPSPVDVPPPASVPVTTMSIEKILPGGCNPDTGICESKNLTCSGHALMADGNLFFGGGSHGRALAGDIETLLDGTGIRESLTYYPVQNTWARNASAVGIGAANSQPLRWYPTVTRLSDARMMLTGGYENVTPVLGPLNRSVEVFDPNTNAWSVVSDYNNTPDGIGNYDYTHVFQFPADLFGGPSTTDHAVMMLGGSGEPFLLLLSAHQSAWRPSGNHRPGARQFIERNAPMPVQPNHRSSSAMLPLRLPEAGWGYSNGSIISVGGETGSGLEGNIDVYDPALNQWRSSIPMIGPRQHPAVTLLPDGRMLILAGYAEAGNGLTGYAEYVDPKDNFAHSVGAAYMPEVRGYHSMVVLLPDGRVMIGGGNDDGGFGNEKPNFRYYYPDYMFKQRPRISSVQGTITINQRFPVMVPHATSVDEVSLLSLGAMTHSFDMGQRSVQLRLDPTATTVRLENGKPVPVRPEQCATGRIECFDQYHVQAPTSRNMAPPGHYMFFVLDKDRVPSMGMIVRLEP